MVRGLEPSDTYNRKSWTVIYDLALERSCNLLMVSGQVLDDPHDHDGVVFPIRLIGQQVGMGQFPVMPEVLRPSLQIVDRTL